MIVLAAISRILFLAVSVATVDCGRYAATAEPGSVLMTFASTADTRGFAWHTDVSVAESEVRILEGGHGCGDDALFEREGRLFRGSCRTVGDPKLNRHAVRVTGLAPGAYSYRLGGSGHYAYGRFAVKPEGGSVTIVNLNDAQTKDARKLYQWENAAACAAKTAGGADRIDFVVSGGDFCDGRFQNATNAIYGTFGIYLQWGIAADTATPYFPGVPWVMASGNHDYRLYGDCTAVEYADGVPVGCHSFDYGSVHVATIPFVANKWSRKHEAILDWLASDLASARAAGRTGWTVVNVHWGPYTTGDHGLLASTSDLVRRFGPICASNRVDLVLQAHDHTFSKTLPYRWSGAGYTAADADDAAVNLVPRQEAGADVDPEGTYYVSCGCAGHRVGENAKHAAPKGGKSYRNRACKVVAGRLSVDSKYGRKGDPASADLPRQMFGVLRIDGGLMTYSFYVAEPDGSATLYDELRVRKTETAFSQEKTKGRTKR